MCVNKTHRAKFTCFLNLAIYRCCYTCLSQLHGVDVTSFNAVKFSFSYKLCCICSSNYLGYVAPIASTLLTDFHSRNIPGVPQIA